MEANYMSIALMCHSIAHLHTTEFGSDYHTDDGHVPSFQVFKVRLLLATSPIKVIFPQTVTRQRSITDDLMNITTWMCTVFGTSVVGG